MARTSADALRSLKGIASRWPVDTVRPKLQMSQAIQEAAEKSFGSASPLAATQQRQARQQLTKLESAWAGKFEGSLQRLLDNRAMATYPLSEKILKPSSYPDHYEKLQQGLERFRRGDKPRLSWLEWFGGKKQS